MSKTYHSITLHYSPLKQTFLFYEQTLALWGLQGRDDDDDDASHNNQEMMVMISVLGKACQWSSRSTPDKGAP